MSSKALEILRQTTKSKSRLEVQQFLVERHGANGRGNASADATALDMKSAVTLDIRQKKRPVQTI